jgi:uncharacterized BrkB/YihY/UPF0761 family membrane protein
MIFSPRLLRLRSTGILNRIHRRKLPIKIDEDKILLTSVTIHAVQPILVILAIGVVLANVLMLIERQASAWCRGRQSVAGQATERNRK